MKATAGKNTEMNGQTDRTLHKIITIPNILSFLRLCMIPLIIIPYKHGRPYVAFAVLVLSGGTDIIDGYIARHYHMVSNLGKVLDPIADKLTQGCIILSLLTRFPGAMRIPLYVFIVRESMNAITGSLVIRRTGQVLGAEWHGKVTTVIIWSMLVLFILWPDMPEAFASALSVSATVMMLVSMVLYTFRNIKAIRQCQTGRQDDQEHEQKNAL